METQFTPNVIVGSKIGDYIAGSNIDTPEIVNESGSWVNYPAEHERQNMNGETSSCTVFSFNDMRESLMMYLLHENKIPALHAKWLKDNGYFKNGFINFSDRIPAMYAEIELGVGTYLYKAAEACRKWSLPEDIIDSVKTVDEWYNKAKITQKALDLQKEFDKRFKWVWFCVNDLNEGLKYSPIQGIVSFKNGDDILCPTTPINHAVTALEAKSDYVLIDDSYNQQFKKYCHKGFSNYLGVKLIIKEDIDMDKAKFYKDNDKKIIRNKDTGAFGVIYGGQLLKIEENRAGLFMIDRENRKLIGNIESVQISDNEWTQLWSNRYF